MNLDIANTPGAAATTATECLAESDADTSMPMRQLTNSIGARIIEVSDATTAEALKADRGRVPPYRSSSTRRRALTE